MTPPLDLGLWRIELYCTSSAVSQCAVGRSLQAPGCVDRKGCGGAYLVPGTLWKAIATCRQNSTERPSDITCICESITVITNFQTSREEGEVLAM